MNSVIVKLKIKNISKILESDPFFFFNYKKTYVGFFITIFFSALSRMLDQELLVGKHFLAFRTINSGVIHFYAPNMLGIMVNSQRYSSQVHYLKENWL